MIRQRMGIGVVAWLMSAVALTIGAPAAGAATKSFSYIGGAEQQFTVPAGVSSVTITAIGGYGGSGHLLGGRGAIITDAFAVAPGQTLYVEVAAAGDPGKFCCTAAPGGGGKGGGPASFAPLGGGGGGGASDVRKVPAATPGTLSSRLIVAAGGGGGGGGGASSPGATGGGDAGMAARDFGTTTGGGAGTLIAGGAGGAGFQAPRGAPGVVGAGGDGGGSSGVTFGGGGGGGGFYGGGGGGASNGTSGAQGGGGGSSYSQGGATASPTSALASITFTYVVDAAPPPATTPPATTPPGTTPPGTTPPGTTPPGTTPPGARPPGTTPPGATPPGTTPPGTGTAPSVSALGLSRSAFRAARSGSSTSTQMVAGLPRVSYSLDAPAGVRFGVERATIGRRVGGRCVATSRTNRKRSRCTRLVRLPGSFTRDRPEGDDSFTFTGRLARRALSPGSYRLVVTPITDGRSGMTRRATFRIIRPR